MSMPPTFVVGIGVGASIACLLMAFQYRSKKNKHSPSGLRLIGEIQLPEVSGRLDHCAFDQKRKLMFQTCLGDDSVAVIDCFASTVLCKIQHQELSRPQGALFVEETCSLFIANAANGKVLIFNGKPGDPTAWNFSNIVDFGGEADNLRLDPEQGQVLVGYGEGAIGFIDTKTKIRCSRSGPDFNCPEHPESFQLARSSSLGRRIYVNIADKKCVQVS
jgi:hypothetical protein